MASTATWTSVLIITGDAGNQTLPINATANAASPVYDVFVNLVLGVNTFAVPGAGTTTRVTIIPPTGNTQLITLKGVTGDTGVPLHKTDPSSFGLDTTFASLVLNAAGAVTGFRLIWS